MRAGVLEAAVLLIAAILLSYILFVPPMVGLASQGDFMRIMTGAGLDYPPELTARQRDFCYFQNRFRIVPATTPPLASTESLLVAIALGIHRVSGTAGWFDLRVLGAVHLAFFLGALYLLMREARGLRWRSRVLLGVLLIFVGCDIGYSAYFNSMYLEPASYIFGIVFVAAAVRLVREPSAAGLLWATAAMVLFAGSKSQNVPMCLFAAVFVAVLIRPRWKAAVGVSAAVLIGLAVGSAAVVPERVRRLNLYNSIFMQELPFSATPVDDLRELGLDGKLAAFSGKSAFFPGAPVYDTRVYPGGATYRGLLRLYLEHPERLVRLTGRGVLESLSNRTVYLGNYLQADSPRCLTFTKSFGLWDAMRWHLHVPWIFFPLMAGLWIGPVWLARRTGDVVARRLLWLQFCFATMAAIAFYTAILGDGNEFRKHLFPFSFCVDACLVASALWVSELARSGGPKRARLPR